jgi:hypothetical protein
LACNSRGYQASGTEIVRPSLKSTIRLSSVTITLWALASTVKELIPTPQQAITVLLNQCLYPIDLISTIPTAILQSDGIEPELGDIVVTFNMSVRRLVAVGRVKEEPISPMR